MSSKCEVLLIKYAQFTIVFDHNAFCNLTFLDKKQFMAIIYENIQFSDDEPFRLLSWQKNTLDLVLLGMSNNTKRVRGVGGRWHSHPEMQLTVVTSGTGTRYIGDSVASIEAGECVLVGAHVPHCWVFDVRSSGYFLHFNFSKNHPVRRLGGESLDKLIADSEYGLSYEKTVTEEVVAMFPRIASSQRLTRIGCLIELIGKLIDASRNRSERVSELRVRSASRNARPATQIEEVVQWILENYTEPLSLEDALTRCSMSRATFGRQFMKHTGKSFVRFVNDVRLAYAYQLLLRSNRSITDIAFASGFGSVPRFNAAFRERYNTAPRSLRKRKTDA
jgi:AraC-like DNA-binding protein/mannose-6-phosphate isomerase-like protein (cupin superfamily)